ncbi:hypothetical protein BJ875DRAFT_448677 [Amylocarpus encephaloides]|uniref:Protein kinase domain-containing protein n=1 Tax=Amylocarpus encephaloides TaxID=45428 RepID=A0A9P7YU27_9HELO|nr:hypothetical protein BJ875DRAFT_448677 [Amylocarpus encephaloides]
MRMATCILVEICLALCLLFWILDIANINKNLDVKPDNILIDYGSGSSRFREAELDDYCDVRLCPVNSKDHLKLA